MKQVLVPSRIELSLAFALLPLGCTGAEPPNLDKAAVAAPTNDHPIYRPRGVSADTGDEFTDEVLPVLAQRCVTCHGCGDSPCQLKLSSFEGVVRGSSQNNVFYGSRPLSVPDNRLSSRRVERDDGSASGSIDYAATEAAWRDVDYYSVLRAAAGGDSVFARVLDRGQWVPVSDQGELGRAYEIFRERKQLIGGPDDPGSMEERRFECVGEGADEARLEALIPGRAMPLGLPRLDRADHDVLRGWLRSTQADLPSIMASAEAAHPQIATPGDAALVAKWEGFFAGEQTPRQSRARVEMVMRYLFEHLYFARLSFPGSLTAGDELYELVRSRTPSGEPIDEIVTHRPSDPVTEGPLYYRLRRVTHVVARKDNIIWRLRDADLVFWKNLFFDAEWGEDLESGILSDENPFRYFRPIPKEIRYRFMLSNSSRFVEAMVRGSVCTGSRATFAIRDRFWAFFLKPEADPSVVREDFGLGWRDNLTPNSASLDRERRYLRAHNDGHHALARERGRGLQVADLWVGEGDEVNPNNWLTVLRHEKSSTVHQGPVGGRPETMWVLGYANFERLFYDLVVEYAAWNGLPHKLDTWQLMSFIRAEGEETFMAFLPLSVRDVLRADNNASAGSFFHELAYRPVGFRLETGVGYRGNYEGEARPGPLPGNREPTLAQARAAVEEFLGFAEAHLRRDLGDPLNTPDDSLRRVASAGLEGALDSLTQWRSESWQSMPEATVLRIGDRAFTLIRTSVYSSHKFVFEESRHRDPARDSMAVVEGIPIAFPRYFIDVDPSSVDELVTVLHNIGRGSVSFPEVAERYRTPGAIQFIARDTEAFWPFLDWVHRYIWEDDPAEAGIVDVSEYFWPASVADGG